VQYSRSDSLDGSRYFSKIIRGRSRIWGKRGHPRHVTLKFMVNFKDFLQIKRGLRPERPPPFGYAPDNHGL
jgi:hypothetical protein